MTYSHSCLNLGLQKQVLRKQSDPAIYDYDVVITSFIVSKKCSVTFTLIICCD